MHILCTATGMTEDDRTQPEKALYGKLCFILRKYRLAIENICCILVLCKKNLKIDPIPFLLILPLLVYCHRYWNSIIYYQLSSPMITLVIVVVVTFCE